MNAANISNRRLKEIRSLTQRKYRQRLGETLVEGIRSVESAIDGGASIREILVTEEAHSKASPLLERADRPVHILTSSEMEEISAVENSQGILAVAEIVLLDAERLGGMQRIVAFDGIRDPGNAGTLIRTAAWFGADAVLTAPGTVDLYNPKVIRSAMGGIWDVGHAEVVDLGDALTDLRGLGYSIYGADLQGTPIGAWQPRSPSVLLLGSEAHGLSAVSLERLDERVLIPGGTGRGGAESLNVAVAAGILMYEWTSGLAD